MLLFTVAVAISLTFLSQLALEYHSFVAIDLLYTVLHLIIDEKAGRCGRSPPRTKPQWVVSSTDRIGSFSSALLDFLRQLWHKITALPGHCDPWFNVV
jgi:hypothetical protein